MDNEALPLRSSGIRSNGAVPSAVVPSNKVTRDEEQYSTLKAAFLSIEEGMAALDQWHAFDLQEQKGPTGLTIKQQIVAHQKAYDILAPIRDGMEAALKLVDDKYKQ